MPCAALPAGRRGLRPPGVSAPLPRASVSTPRSQVTSPPPRPRVWTRRWAAPLSLEASIVSGAPGPDGSACSVKADAAWRRGLRAFTEQRRARSPEPTGESGVLPPPQSNRQNQAPGGTHAVRSREPWSGSQNYIATRQRGDTREGGWPGGGPHQPGGPWGRRAAAARQAPGLSSAVGVPPRGKRSRFVAPKPFRVVPVRSGIAVSDPETCPVTDARPWLLPAALCF